MATSSESSVPPHFVALPGPELTDTPGPPDLPLVTVTSSLSEAERRRTNHAPADPVELFGFVAEGNACTASAPGGREWRVSQELTGWRLEFRDSGDPEATNAGVHPSLEAAMREARR
jgi:hypothetical protein